MLRRTKQRIPNRTPVKTNAGVTPQRRGGAVGKRARVAGGRDRSSYMPPENWHEPAEEAKNEYRLIVQSPGNGYRHVVTPEEVMERLSLLPDWMISSLEVVQFSRMTRKKRTFPCYGMQWGNAIYLYPVEEDRVEHFTTPPKPAQIIEARMYGARWEAAEKGLWRLVWTEAALKDFYLNNILIHELGHLLDARNTSYADRERYAEWFAIEHGYKPSRKAVADKAAAMFFGK